jgi:hypothetical protein
MSEETIAIKQLYGINIRADLSILIAGAGVVLGEAKFIRIVRGIVIALRVLQS